MDKLINFIVDKRKWFLIAFIVLLVASVVAIFFVKVNYNSADYLPDDSKTKAGMVVMYDEFGEGGNASAMVKDVSYNEAVRIKEKVSGVDGVASVMWLDDVFSGITTDVIKTYEDKTGSIVSEHSIVKAILYSIKFLPRSELTGTELSDGLSALLIYAQASGLAEFDMSLLDEFKPSLEMFYKDGCALYQIGFTGTDYSDSTVKAIDEIRKMEFESYFTGNAAITYNSIKIMNRETLTAMAVVVVIILIILFLFSSSFWEPVLFIAAIGVAVILNMGTNIIMGEISYMTQGVAAILQLALTMDYSIFLLHRFKQERASGLSAEDAMKRALKMSFSPISASSMTTVSSFIALMFMSYTIGLDMGIVLAKGTILSLLSVFLFLPALTIYTHKLLDRSEHKTFSLKFDRLSKFLVKSRKVLPILFLCIIIPAFVLQSMNSFTYGNMATFGSEGSIIAADKTEVEAVFGTQNQTAVLIPIEYADKEAALTKDLAAMDSVLSAQSYGIIEETGMLGFLPESFLKQFRSEKDRYSRIVVFLDVPDEGEETVKAIDGINAVLEKYVGDDYYVLGESASAIEIKAVVEFDYNVITIISVLLVLLVLLFTYRSLIIPIILVFVIEGSIFVNLAIPYFSHEPMVFIGYMIVSAILLGATIDYAILMTSNYMEARRMMTKYDAMKEAISKSAKAILVSAGIFTFAGFSIGFVSTMPAIRVFGGAIGRGGLAALVMVMILLPQLLLLFDKAIMKTTMGGKLKMPDDETINENALIRQCVEALDTERLMKDYINETEAEKKAAERKSRRKKGKKTA